MINVSLVPYKEINNVWPKIRKFAAMVEEEAAGRVTIDDIYNDLIDGKYLLWVAFEKTDDGEIIFRSFACTSVKFYPNKRMVFIDYLGGEHMEKWVEAMEETVSNFAASQECDGIEFVGRKGWEKPFNKMGWKTKYYVIEKVFSNPLENASI